MAALSSRTFSPVCFSNLLLWLAVSLALIGALTPLSAAQAQAPTVLYVDKDAPGPTHDGASWATAYTTVQDAIDMTNANGSIDYEIWVAAGTYYPDEGGSHADNSRSESFRLNYDNVQLYGGFGGTETARDERDWTAHPTILSGDIDGGGTLMNNAYHVLWLDGVTNEQITAATVLDGFIVTGGNADDFDPDDSGAGLYCAGDGSGHACSPTLRNLIISGNTASSYGGGIYNDSWPDGESSPTLTNVTISGNSATYGGGMYNDGYEGGESSPTLTNVTISGNVAAEDGGGIYSDGGYHGESMPTLTDVTISGNRANDGGGMYNSGYFYGESRPVLTNVTISGNRANDGGGMYNSGEEGGVSSPQLTNVTINGNSASDEGGGMYNSSMNGGVSSPALTGVTISGNSATNGGGGMYNNGYTGVSSPTLTNTTVSGNYASYGGGIVNAGYNGESSPTLTNVTISGNYAEVGGGMYSDGEDGESSPLLRNSIVWGNTGVDGMQLYNYENTATLDVSYSDIQGGYAGTGNLDADPLFAAPIAASSAPTSTGDYRLLPGSPAIDAGTNTDAPNNDLRGLPRPINAVTDMGAYESQGFTLAITGGDAQTATAGSAFAQPLIVQISSAIAEPVRAGIVITFTPPTSGPGLSVSGPFTLTTDAAGTVTTTVTANGLAGSYDVAVTAGSGITPAAFHLTNGPFYLTAAAAGTGSGAVTSTPAGIDCGPTCTAAFDYNTSVTLAANANTGSTFSGWSGACSGTGSCTVTMTENKAVTATFTLNQYTVAASADPTAGGTVSGGGAVSHGDTVTVVAAPNTGYTFAKWTEGGTEVSTSPTYSFTASGSRTLVAHFALKEYTVAVSADPTAGGTVSGGGTVSHGDNVTVTATANTGYIFVNWTEGATEVSTSPTYSFTASGNRTLVAHFTQLAQPLAHNDAAGVLQGRAVDVPVLANDYDPAGHGLTVVAVSQPAHGTASINTGGSVHYAAPSDFYSEDSFTYTVQDANGLTSTATVAIVIAPIRETTEAPQLAVINPTVQNTAQFTGSLASVQAELPAGFYSGTVSATDIFFLAYTPVLTPTEHALTPPGTLKFGGLQFNLTVHQNSAPLHGIQFAQPVTLVIQYDPALLAGLQPETLQLFYWNGEGWNTSGVTIVDHDTAKGTLTVALNHLSEFAFFAAPAPDADAVHVYLPIVGKE